jgi:hypothetical protein
MGVAAQRTIDPTPMMDLPSLHFIVFFPFQSRGGPSLVGLGTPPASFTGRCPRDQLSFVATRVTPAPSAVRLLYDCQLCVMILLQACGRDQYIPPS